jgi:hypothetical protein|tara:strand:+ start:146 stop:424 length:279 start_codon:yes stop_codon:yes gene_type:complete
MTERFELKTARTDANGKTWWTKIGVMFPFKSGKGFNLIFEAMPIPTLNEQGQLEVRVMGMEPYQDDGTGAKPNNAPPSRSTEPAKLDDEIPF